MKKIEIRIIVDKSNICCGQFEINFPSFKHPLRISYFYTPFTPHCVVKHLINFQASFEGLQYNYFRQVVKLLFHSIYLARKMDYALSRMLLKYFLAYN